MFLHELKIGDSGVVTSVGGEGALRQHFLDMGVIPGTVITLIKYAPMGDPMEFRVRGYELTLRRDDAMHIGIRPVDQQNAKPKQKDRMVPANVLVNHDEKGHIVEHPGLGEGGRFHDKDEEDPLNFYETLTFALAGNQNCGKTTLFNQLTGSNQHVGNFPGVTVDQKSGEIRNQKATLVTDLPGIYSLSPYTAEEIVSREFILHSKPKGIINIVDATNIDRNLYLTLQLMELDVPMVIALNMMDEVIGNGGYIHINRMEEMLGVPVVPISAMKNEGIDELISHAMHVAKYQEKPGRHDFCGPDRKGGALHRCLHGITHLIQDHAERAALPARFAATKLVEGDPMIMDSLKLDQNEKEMIEHIILQMEEESGMDRSAAVADMRFTYIEKIVDKCVVRPKESRESERTRRIDKVLTGRYTAIPCFIGIMASIFYLTFGLIGPYLQGQLEHMISLLSVLTENAFEAWQVNAILTSLVIDGIFEGVGAVVSFLPLIVLLFLFLSLLEDSGYMARVAFMMDKLLRKIGLSGRSIVPLLVGFGCSVPGIMSSRTLPSARDRKMTVLLIPYISCTAKLPVYGFLAAAFFPKRAGLVIVLLYGAGILAGIAAAHFAKKTVFKGEAVPFVMELPNYRFPGAKNVLQLLWEKAKDFLQKAFTVIFIATMIIWFLQHFTPNLKWTDVATDSILAVLAGWIAPVFIPAGFGDWRIVTALIVGFIAKESVVSTLMILVGSGIELAAVFGPASGAALLTFCLLYTPCIAAIAAVKREFGRIWAFGIVLLQCMVAWGCALLVYRIACLFM